MEPDFRQQPFHKQVAHYLKQQDFRGPSLWMGRTPACLRMLGFADLPFRMTQGVLRKIYTGKGGIRVGVEAATICRMPTLIDEPVAIFDSHTEIGALVVLTSGADAGGAETLIVSVQSNLLDGNAMVNMITSAYSKQRAEWVKEQVNAGRLRYADKEKGPSTLEVSSHTLYCGAEPGSGNPSGQTILCPDDLRKYRDEQRAKNLAGLAVP